MAIWEPIAPAPTTRIWLIFGSDMIYECDVGSDEQIDATFAALGQRWEKFDGLVHSIGFAPREAIAGNFLDGLSREGFRIAHDISAYSFPALAKAAMPLLNDKASLLTLTYPGPTGTPVNRINNFRNVLNHNPC